MYFITFYKIHGYFYSIVPFLILVVVNSLLIYHSLNLSSRKALVRSKNRRAKHRTMTFTIVILTCMFICCTFPYAIATGYWFLELSTTRSGITVINFFSILSFSYHGLNFVVFFLTNRKFLFECKSLFRDGKNLSYF